MAIYPYVFSNNKDMRDYIFQKLSYKCLEKIRAYVCVSKASDRRTVITKLSFRYKFAEQS